MDREKEIVKWLKQFKRLSTSRFVGLLGIDYDSIKKILEQLEERKIIKKEIETNAVYWVLMENKNA